MFGRDVLVLLVGCVGLLGVTNVGAADPAAAPYLGAGMYEPAAAAGDVDCARWDWMLINFGFGHVTETPEAIELYNRYLAINPRQKYLVRVWPIDGVGLPEYGLQANFLDYWFNDAVRQKIRDRIRQQIKLVRNHLDKPENVVGYTFLEEVPGHWGLGREIKTGSTLRRGSKLPAAVEHYRRAIEKAYGRPVQWNEPFWRWLGERYVASINDIHKLIRDQAPGKLIFYWHHIGYQTLDEASFDGFPGTHPALYPYRFGDIIKKPLCDGIMAYAGIRQEGWEKRYMSHVRKNGWLFFSQLSHPSSMRTVNWATALKQVKEPLPQNLGYFLFCSGTLDNVPASPLGNPSALKPLADPATLKLEASGAGRFLVRVDEPGHGKVIRVSQGVDQIATHAFQTDIPVTAGKAYQWAVSVKTRKVQGAKGADGAYMLIAFDGPKASALRRDFVLRLTGDKDWTRLRGQVVAPAHATKARVYVGMSRAAGAAWFDGVSLRTADEDRELVTNGGFEKGRDNPLEVTGWFIRDDSITIRHWRAFCDEQGIGRDVVQRADTVQLDAP